MTEENQIFIAPNKLAKQIGVNKATINRWCIEGTIGATKLGGRWLIPADTAQTLLDAARNPKTAA